MLLTHNQKFRLGLPREVAPRPGWEGVPCGAGRWWFAPPGVQPCPPAPASGGSSSRRVCWPDDRCPSSSQTRTRQCLNPRCSLPVPGERSHTPRGGEGRGGEGRGGEGRGGEGRGGEGRGGEEGVGRGGKKGGRMADTEPTRTSS